MIIRFIAKKILLPIGVIAVAGALIAGSVMNTAQKKEDGSNSTSAVSFYMPV